MPTIIENPKGKSEIIDYGNRLVISILPKRNVFIIIISLFWIFLFNVFRFTFDPYLLHAIGTWPIKIFYLVEIFLIIVLSWTLWGKEVLTIENNFLKIEKTVFGFGPKREYNLSKVINLRPYSSMYYGVISVNPFKFWGLSGGKIIFDYDTKTITCGNAIDTPEAGFIVNIILGSGYYKGI